MNHRSILVLMVTLLSTSFAGAQSDDSLLPVQGAEGWVPCNDGSLISAVFSCRDRVAYPYMRCATPSITRSWDGGKTWKVESIIGADYARAGIVRLFGGRLLTNDTRTHDGILLSDDNGHTWYPIFDTTGTADNSMSSAFGLTRDTRGILYWSGYISLDNGRTQIPLNAEYSSFYVLPPDGLIVSHDVGARHGPPVISMSFNHGRSYVHTLEGDEDSYDTNRDLFGIFVAHNTLGVREYLTLDRGPWTVRTLYWSQVSRSWVPGRYIDVDWDNIVDSAGYWYGTQNGVEIQGPSDTIGRKVVEWLTLGSPLPTDTTVQYGYESMQGIYYDLDGAVHPHNSLIRLPIQKPRPVSIVDRLYTCSGIEYVLGGHRIDSVWIDNTRTFNAKLTYVTTINRRLSTVLVTAINPAIRMHFSILIDDRVTGLQRFSDAVPTVESRPRIALNTSNTKALLECTWPDGPYMWLHNGEPVPKLHWLAMNGDSVLRDLKPGVYKVVGRTQFGCEVFSNEVAITGTDVANEATPAGASYAVRFDDMGLLRVTWSGVDTPQTILVYDVLGRLLEADVTLGMNDATVRLHERVNIAFVVITNSGIAHGIGALYQP